MCVCVWIALLLKSDYYYLAQPYRNSDSVHSFIHCGRKITTGLIVIIVDKLGISLRILLLLRGVTGGNCVNEKERKIMLRFRLNLVVR